MHIKTDENDSLEVQMGPLIDCVFLLLIFFIVIAVTKKSIKELGIQLPASSAAALVKPKDKDLLIRVKADGEVYIGSTQMTQNMYINAIKSYAQKYPNGKVRLEADKHTQLESLMPLMDEVELCGLKNVGIRSYMD